jgi:hypothetical protein
VGQFLTAGGKELPRFAVAFPSLITVAVGHASPFVVVSEDEESFPPMTCSHGCGFKQERSWHSVAEPVQVSGDFGQTLYDMTGHVLEEAEPRSALVKDAGNVGPQVPGVGGSEPFPCNGERLAGIAAKDAIHDAAPRSAVKGLQIRPTRCVIQPPFFHAACQDFAAVTFPFDIADRASAWNRQSEAEIKPSDAGTEGETTDFGR